MAVWRGGRVSGAVGRARSRERAPVQPGAHLRGGPRPRADARGLAPEPGASRESRPGPPPRPPSVAVPRRGAYAATARADHDAPPAQVGQRRAPSRRSVAPDQVPGGPSRDPGRRADPDGKPARERGAPVPMVRRAAGVAAPHGLARRTGTRGAGRGQVRSTGGAASRGVSGRPDPDVNRPSPERRVPAAAGEEQRRWTYWWWARGWPD